jgi:tetratricopeptide (TPR) repeat protein
MKAIALAALLALQAPVQDDESARLVVELEVLEGETLCTVSSREAPLYEVVREIAERADLELDGFRDEWQRLLVSAELRRRPLRQALSYLLGSVDLEADVRQGALYVRPAPDDPGANELFERAAAFYQRVLRDFPDHPQAALVLHDLASIEEHRGSLAAARARYEALIQQFPDSELVPGALIRVGRILQGANEWSEARVRFEDLLRLPQPHEFEHEARIELVRCLTRTGEGERALDILDQLDVLAPAKTLEETTDRRLLRARSLYATGSAPEALEALASVTVSRLSEEQRLDYLEIEASACDEIGEPARAARAWLAFASSASDPAGRSRGLAQAARSSLAAEDELGALFVSELARRQGVAGPEVAAAIESASLALRADVAGSEAIALRQRVERGERLLAAGAAGEALDALRSAAKRSGELDPALRLRFALAYGRSLASEINVDAALALFREQLSSLEDPEARRAVYVLAGELLEAAGRTDEAIEAYRGRI